MNREDFTAFATQTIENVIQLAEEQCGAKLGRKFVFRWLNGSYGLVSEKVAEHITERVFVDEEHIFPCVDIGVGDVLEDGTLVIVANVAGYPPRPFGENWKGKLGPFIYIVGYPFLNKMTGKKDHPWSPGKPFGFITPKVPS